LHFSISQYFSFQDPWQKATNCFHEFLIFLFSKMIVKNIDYPLKYCSSTC